MWVHPFFLREKICKHRRDVIVGWNCILVLKYSHFLCPLQWQITERAHWALQCAPGRDPSPGPECQHLLSHNMLWKWLKSSLSVCLSLWEIQLSCNLTEVQMEEKTEEATVQKKRGNSRKMKGERVFVLMANNKHITRGYSHVVYNNSNKYNSYFQLKDYMGFYLIYMQKRDTHCQYLDKVSSICFVVYQNNWHWHYYVWLRVFVHSCRDWQILVHARVHSLTLQCVKSGRWCWQTAEHLVSKCFPLTPFLCYSICLE